MEESSPSLKVLDKYNGNKSDCRPQTAATKQQGQDEYNRKLANAGKDNTNKQLQVDIVSNQATKINKGNEVFTGQAGRGAQRGGELTHVRHEEVEFDHSADTRAPATPIPDTGQKQGRFNNKSGDRLSKKKREAIKKGNMVKVPPDDYRALNSDDAIDHDN
ncbi:hypothetical protein KY285_035844 [Solanum tuberosum]|nr:hypothetical protein KY289_036020 [Solanum tuberosum]KAH0639258.1 hypothetical protein KY285_035844 [Solanum tuberosum]